MGLSSHRGLHRRGHGRIGPRFLALASASSFGSIGGIIGADPRNEEPAPLRSTEKPFQRGPFRSEISASKRLKHGRLRHCRYNPAIPERFLRDLRLRFIRTQRDEVDAIEALARSFGTSASKTSRPSMTRAHHPGTKRATPRSVIGRYSRRYDPFELRNRLTGSTCRGPIGPAFAMAEINLFGEVGVLKTINGLIDTARERQDACSCTSLIHSRRRAHSRPQRPAHSQMHDHLGAQELELRTRELFTECLVSLGAVKSDMDVFTVSREDIEHLVGNRALAAQPNQIHQFGRFAIGSLHHRRFFKDRERTQAQ